MLKNKKKIIIEKQIKMSRCNNQIYKINNITMAYEDSIYYHPKFSKTYISSEYRSYLKFTHKYGINGLNYNNIYFNINNIILNTTNNTFVYRTDYGDNLVHLTKKGFNKFTKYLDFIKNLIY